MLHCNSWNTFSTALLDTSCSMHAAVMVASSMHAAAAAAAAAAANA